MSSPTTMSRRCQLARPAPLSLLLLTFLFTLTVSLIGVDSTIRHVHAKDVCVDMPPTSVCAGFYPPGTSVSVGPTFNCTEDAEASLASGPLIWASLNILTSQIPGATCSRDFAQLMCLVIYRPCDRPVSRDFCQATIGSVNETSGAPISGSCPLQIVQGFLATVIPNFSAIFDCTMVPLFYPEPLGAGVQLPQSDPLHPIMVPADQCQPLNSKSICRGAVDYPVYIPWSLQAVGGQPYIENKILGSFTSAMITANVATGCLESLSKLLCSSVYLRCDTTVLQTSLGPYIPATDPMSQILPALQIPFPRLPCRGLCQQVQDQCQQLLSTQPALQALANCTGVGSVLTPTKTCGAKDVPGTAGSNFPVTTSTLASLKLGVYTVYIQSKCNEFNTTAYSAASLNSVFECPYPLVRSWTVDDDNAVLGGSCATPCPALLFTKDQWDSGSRFTSGFTITSFLCSLWIWLTWVIFPSKRKQTNTLMFNTCVLGLHLFMSAMVFDTNFDPSRVSCRNTSQYKTMSDGGVCLAQSMAYLYFTLAGVAFWLQSSIDLFLRIVLNIRLDSARQLKLNKIYTITGWSFPVPFFITALAMGVFGGSTGAPWCFLNVADAAQSDMGIFFYPVLVMLCFGVVFIIAIMRTTMVSLRYTAGNAATRKALWWTSQIRLFLFLLVYCGIFAFVFGYRILLYQNETLYKDSAIEFVGCLIATLGDHVTCGDRPKTGPDIGLWYMIQLAVAGLGLFNAMIFGTQWTNVLLWYGFLSGKGTDWAGKAASRGTQDESKVTEMSRPSGKNGTKKEGRAQGEGGSQREPTAGRKHDQAGSQVSQGGGYGPPPGGYGNRGDVGASYGEPMTATAYVSTAQPTQVSSNGNKRSSMQGVAPTTHSHIQVDTSIDRPIVIDDHRSDEIILTNVDQHDGPNGNGHGHTSAPLSPSLSARSRNSRIGQHSIGHRSQISGVSPLVGPSSNGKSNGNGHTPRHEPIDLNLNDADSTPPALQIEPAAASSSSSHQQEQPIPSPSAVSIPIDSSEAELPTPLPVEEVPSSPPPASVAEDVALVSHEQIEAENPVDEAPETAQEEKEEDEYN